MDIALSIVAGLGLRLFIITATDAGTTSPLTAALLGLWEGIVVHQLSGRSSSPHLDHFLAYTLRIAVDLLISKNYPRILMILLWTALGSISSEAVVPHASLLAQRKKEREREKERRHRHTRSVPTAVPILSTPLPPRIRAYRQPDQSQAVPAAPSVPDPSQPGPSTSTPHFPLIPPPSPPSFFLQENSEFYSPPPKPVQLQNFNNDALAHDALPVRPPSALASILDRSPDSGSPLPVPAHLPTPPASAESGVPSDSQNIDDYPIQESRRLSTIDELSADESPDTDEQNDDTLIPETTNVITVNYAPSVATMAPLPVPNTGLRYIANGGIAKWLTSQTSKHDPETIFNNPFSPSSRPIPVPVPVRNQGTIWQTVSPTRSHVEDEVKQAEDGVFEVEVGGDNPADIDEPQSASESDELRTPGAKPILNMETDNEIDNDELRTPRIYGLPVGNGYNDNGDLLSPLALNMHSEFNSSEEFVHVIAESEESSASGSGQHSAANSEQLPSPKINTNDYDLPIPGSLSQNPLLQPPLPPSGPLIRPPPSPPPESPIPPSPSTIASEASDASILSTRLPSKLYSKGDAIRKTAWEREQLRSKLEADRKQAENEKRVGDALKLKIQIKELDKESLKLHEKAARRYYAARNPVGMSTKIDVHGLRSREAFERIERALLKVIDEGKNTLRVIVGKGLHSVNNQPVLKNTVQREMLRQGFKCEVDVRNPGILIVTIPPPNPSS